MGDTNSTLGPCIHDSAAIGSLADLRRQLTLEIGTQAQLPLQDLYGYTLYNLLQVECEAFEYLWNRSFGTTIPYHTIPWIPGCTQSTVIRS